MSITVRWENDAQTIALVEFVDPWSWDELYAVAREHEDMLNSVNHRVNSIFFTDSARIQIPSNAIGNLHRLINISSPNEDLIVIVGGPQLLKSMMDLLRRVYRSDDSILERYRFVNRMDEARAIVEARMRGYKN